MQCGFKLLIFIITAAAIGIIIFITLVMYLLYAAWTKLY